MLFRSDGKEGKQGPPGPEGKTKVVYMLVVPYGNGYQLIPYTPATAEQPSAPAAPAPIPAYGWHPQQSYYPGYSRGYEIPSPWR